MRRRRKADDCRPVLRTGLCACDSISEKSPTVVRACGAISEKSPTVVRACDSISEKSPMGFNDLISEKSPTFGETGR